MGWLDGLQGLFSAPTRSAGATAYHLEPLKTDTGHGFVVVRIGDGQRLS